MAPARPMTNPWKSRPIAICVTPLAGLVAQIVVMGIATIRSADPSHGDHGARLFLFGMCIPLVSVPALFAAAGELGKPKGRGWGITGALLNGAYLLMFLAMGLALWRSSRETVIGVENEPPPLLARPDPSRP